LGYRRDKGGTTKSILHPRRPRSGFPRNDKGDLRKKFSGTGKGNWGEKGQKRGAEGEQHEKGIKPDVLKNQSRRPKNRYVQPAREILFLRKGRRDEMGNRAHFTQLKKRKPGMDN